MAFDDLVNPKRINIIREISSGGAELRRQEQRQEVPQEQAQEQHQEQARGQRVTAERVTGAETNKDVEAARLNASVEGLGFFRLQLGSGQLRPAGAAQPTQERPRSRSRLDRFIRILGFITAVLFILAVGSVIWQLVQGEQAPPIVSASYEGLSIAFIGSLLAFGGFTLVSLKIRVLENRLAEMAQQIEANQRTEEEPRAEVEREQKPEFVIASPNRPTLYFKARDDKILAQLKQIRNKSSDIEWTEKCLEDEEITDEIQKIIENLETGRQRVVKLVPDREHEGIAVTFETEYRIPL
jgi:hypothetical protein